MKFKKYPKKPKAGASLATLENYIAKCKEIDKENEQRKRDHKKRLDLKKKVQAMKQKR